MRLPARLPVGLPFRCTPQVAWSAWVLFLSIVTVSVFTSSRRGVYPIFAEAGRAWLRGDDAYAKDTGLDRFFYAPGIAAFFSPWALLPDRLGGALWRLASTAFFALALANYLRSLRLQAERISPALQWLMIIPLIGASVHNGQTNLFLLALLLFSVTSIQKRRWWLAALCLASAGLIKIYPLFLALLLGLRYPQLLGRLLAVLGAGLLAPFLTQTPAHVWDQYQSWLGALTAEQRALWGLERAPRDLFLLTRLTGEAMPAPLYTAIQASLTLLIAFLCVRLPRARRDQREPVALHVLLTLSCCWMLTLGPAAESSTFCFLAPAIVAALAATQARSSAPPWFLWSIYACLAVSAVLCWFPFGKHCAGVLQPLAGVAFFCERLGWALGLRQRKRAAAATQERIYASRLALPQESVSCAAKV